MPHYNAHLKSSGPDADASHRHNGTFERYDVIDNIVHQTRSAPPDAWETALANAMESAFLAGVSTLPDLTAHLNGAGVADPSGSPWTAVSLVECLEALGEPA